MPCGFRNPSTGISQGFIQAVHRQYGSHGNGGQGLPSPPHKRYECQRRWSSATRDLVRTCNSSGGMAVAYTVLHLSELIAHVVTQHVAYLGNDRIKCARVPGRCTLTCTLFVVAFLHALTSRGRSRQDKSRLLAHDQNHSSRRCG